MQGHISLLHHWRVNVNEVDKNLSLLSNRIQPNAVHDLRVAIKKLRAYAELLSRVNCKAAHSIQLAKTRELFDILGKHREWEIAGEYVKKLSNGTSELPANFLQHIQFTKRQLGVILRLAASTYSMNELKQVESLIIAVDEECTPAQFSAGCLEVIDEYVDKLKKYCHHFKKQVHKYRKDLKKIYYWISLFPVEYIYNEQQLKELDATLDKLGKWHDVVTVLDKIKWFRKHYLPHGIEEYAFLQKFEEDLEIKEQALFHKLKPGKIIDVLQSSKSIKAAVN